MTEEPHWVLYREVFMRISSGEVPSPVPSPKWRSDTAIARAHAPERVIAAPTHHSSIPIPSFVMYTLVYSRNRPAVTARNCRGIMTPKCMAMTLMDSGMILPL